MDHFKVTKKSLGSIAADYFHDPEDLALSMKEFFEAQLAVGWSLSGTSDAANGPYWIFKANAQ